MPDGDKDHKIIKVYQKAYKLFFEKVVNSQSVSNEALNVVKSRIMKHERGIVLFVNEVSKVFQKVPQGILSDTVEDWSKIQDEICDSIRVTSRLWSGPPHIKNLVEKACLQLCNQLRDGENVYFTKRSIYRNFIVQFYKSEFEAGLSLYSHDFSDADQPGLHCVLLELRNCSEKKFNTFSRALDERETLFGTRVFSSGNLPTPNLDTPIGEIGLRR